MLAKPEEPQDSEHGAAAGLGSGGGGTQKPCKQRLTERKLRQASLGFAVVEPASKASGTTVEPGAALELQQETAQQQDQRHQEKEAAAGDGHTCLASKASSTQRKGGKDDLQRQAVLATRNS
jgi:hypothetical protein